MYMDIKSLRIGLGMTQKEMAEKIGVAEFTVRRWESGISKPSPMALKVIEALFPLVKR